MEERNYIEKSMESAALYSAANSVMAAQLISGSESAQVIPVNQKNSSLIQELLLNGQADSIKKIALVAAALYKKQTGEVMDFESCVSVVDNVVELIDSAYQVGIGQIDANTAASRLVDRIESRAIVFLENAIDRGMPVVVDTVCALISKAFPPFSAAVPYVKYFATNMQPVVKTAVRKGIHAISEVAKPFIVRTIESGQRILAGAAEKMRRLITA